QFQSRRRGSLAAIRARCQAGLPGGPRRARSRPRGHGQETIQHALAAGCGSPAVPAEGENTYRGRAIMTTGEWIVLGLFAVGVACSTSLFWWLIRTVRRDARRKD